MICKSKRTCCVHARRSQRPSNPAVLVGWLRGQVCRRCDKSQPIIRNQLFFGTHGAVGSSMNHRLNFESSLHLSMASGTSQTVITYQAYAFS